MGDKRPALTVLAPTYNHEDTIAATLDSILGQKTDYPYIIWLAEDHSTDGTLAVCEEYAAKHPSKIKLIAQPRNTKGRHIGWALRDISTRYFTVLEGDDTWSDKSKIQKALSTLEAKSKFMIFAHDTIYASAADGTRQSLVHDVLKVKPRNPVTFDDAPYLHTSARVYRNTGEFKRHFKDMLHSYDIYLYYYFLDKGPLYYYDEPMSVYNIGSAGRWTKMSSVQQVRDTELANYRANRMLGFRRDGFFSAKVRRPKLLKDLKRLFGMRLGWKAYTLAETRILK